MGWIEVPAEVRDTLFQRWLDGEDVITLAVEVNMPWRTLGRRFREMRQEKGIEQKPLQKIELPEQKSLPDNHEIYQLLRNGPVSLYDLSKKLDRSEETVMKLLDRMMQAGYAIECNKKIVEINTVPGARHKPKIETPLAEDLEGLLLNFAVVSDTHCGSRCCQPTALNSFLRLAAEEYDVKHVLVPGDVTTGLFGYSGQEYDLMPDARPTGKKEAYLATEAQIELANIYYPDDLGLEYYLLGGNHDWWHISKVGIDAVERLARSRKDMYFLGYDSADVPLTDNVSARLWHPSGGLPYALSYRLQKSVEETAFGELSKLIEDDLPPKIRFIFAGHLHVECKFQRGPITASQVGAFEGQTNYLKRKGVFPSIGGQIWRVWLLDSGQIMRVEYTFVPYAEVIDDWMDWPRPSQRYVVGEPEKVNVLFSLKD